MESTGSNNSPIPRSDSDMDSEDLNEENQMLENDDIILPEI
jgi:hypothetical protein